MQVLNDAVTDLHSVWSSPLQIGLCLYFLWELLGPAALAGLGTRQAMRPETVIDVWQR